MTANNRSLRSLRDTVIAAKATRNRMQTENAEDADAGRSPRHSVADLEASRLAVDIAVHEARSAHVNLDGVVPPSVGRLDT